MTMKPIWEDGLYASQALFQKLLCSLGVSSRQLMGLSDMSFLLYHFNAAFFLYPSTYVRLL